MPSELQQRLETKLNRLGRRADAQYGFVSCPVYHGSTTIFPSVEDIENNTVPYVYGEVGNPTISSLLDAWTAMTGAAGSVAVSTGKEAIAIALMTVVKSGDHVLVVDSTYGPTRQFCAVVLEKMNVKTTYYNPLIAPGELRALIQANPNTSVLYLESPGSITMEVQDIPGLTAVAREFGVTCILDNTWATPVFFDAYKHGVDIAVEAGTKYIGGHSDLLIGLVSANEKWMPALQVMRSCFGAMPGNEDCFLTLRGLRTLHLRLKEAERRGKLLASWLQSREEVARVLHPALPGSPGHEFWARDFTGSNGLFSFVVKPHFVKADVMRMLNGMKVFSMGFSWGGFESLAMMFDCTNFRTATRFSPGGILIRLQIGLEDLEDLKEDLMDGLARMCSKLPDTN